MLVVEGKLEALKSAEGSTVTDRELAMAFPGKVGEALNLREVEQLVDQLNRLPSKQAQMELTPGRQIGGSDVVVKNTAQKPWRASLSRNNDGQKSTGEQQWGAGLEWDSPLGLADQLVLRGGHDAVSDHQKTSKNTMLYYNVPWGWWNFSYTYSESDYRALGYTDTFKFKQSGDNQNHQFRAERVIHRDDVSKTSLNVGLAHLRTNNYINEAHLETSSNRLSELQLGINHGRRIGNAFVNLDLGMQNGIGAFDAQANDERDAYGNRQPSARYRKYTPRSYLTVQAVGRVAQFQQLDDRPAQRRRAVQPAAHEPGRAVVDSRLQRPDARRRQRRLLAQRPALEPPGDLGLAATGVHDTAQLGYDQGVISNGRYNGEVHGRVSSNSLELFARGKYVSTSVTFAHSLERPAVMSEREAPIYFRMDFFL